MTSSRSINYTSLVPKDSFIGRYLDFMKDSETPEVYDFWTALWLMSVAVGRRIVVDRPNAPVFLNWYIVLVGESGITRKSTSVRAAKSLAYKLVDDPKQVVSSRITPQMVEQMLAERPTMHICISEMVTAFGKMAGSAHALPGLLTDLYDCPDKRLGGTLYAGSLALEDVFVSLLTATTSTWLLRFMNQELVEGGFTSRTMFVTANKPKKRIAWSESNEQEKDKKLQAIEEDLQALKARSLSTPIRIKPSKSGLKQFRSWYNRHGYSEDSYRQSFEGREDAHLLRLAAFLAINDGTWSIGYRHINRAARVISVVKNDGSRLFRTPTPDDPLIVAVERVKRVLVEAGRDGLTQNNLRLKTRYVNGLNAPRLHNIMNTMHELRLVDKYETVPPGATRPATMWRGTKLLFGETAIQEVLDTLGPLMDG